MICPRACDARDGTVARSVRRVPADRETAAYDNPDIQAWRYEVNDYFPRMGELLTVVLCRTGRALGFWTLFFLFVRSSCLW